MAAQLLDVVGGEHPADDVQAAVLAPLELRLANQPTVEQWDRHRWVETVHFALETFRLARWS